jgi:ankyrin repeat protein
MELILKRGANINALGPDNVTPLSQALLQKTFNLMPVLDLILKHNPNPNIVPTNPKFYPALHTAAKNYADGTVLKKVLAIPGIDLDIRTIDTKRTALHHLICLFASNDTFMHQNAEILLESGLSLNSRDQLGDNCLMSHLRSVQFYPNNNVVKFCLNRGIDLHATNNENQSVPDIIRNRSGELTTYYHYLIVYWDKSAKKIRKAMDKQRQQQRQR